MNKFERIGKMDLVVVDNARIKQAIDIYYHWKDLNTELQTFSNSRGLNFPSELSEYMTGYALGFHINKNSSGDAVDLSDPNNPKIIEIKCCSADDIDAPSSFSPSENFDDLVYVRLEKRNDILKIYRTGINSEDLKKIKVNEKETLGDQQKAGRRPRFSIYSKIIRPLGLEPDAIIDIRSRSVKRK